MNDEQREFYYTLVFGLILIAFGWALLSQYI